MTKKFKFTINNTLGKARTGVITTAHGQIRTPAFMPVGTKATIKAMLPDAVRRCGADIILSNTYHLMLRPTAERIARLGGLHEFMNWSGPILTDSGGFQVMSLASLCKITNEGALFSSHLDGAIHMLTPERATQLQHMFGSTITMVLDQCVSFPASYSIVHDAVNLTTSWAERSKEAFVKRDGYAQFAIMQGGVYKDLRHKSAEDLVKLDFEGYAIGGLAVGEGQDTLFSVLDYATDYLPDNKPKYLMGVGKPSDIIGAVKRGVDMFDCVIPTRSARNGQAFTKKGTVNIRNSKYSEDPSPLDESCLCVTCREYSKAYLHHLIKTDEMLGPILMTWHNLTYFQDLMAQIRLFIEIGKEIDFTS